MVRLLFGFVGLDVFGWYNNFYSNWTLKFKEIKNMRTLEYCYKSYEYVWLNVCITIMYYRMWHGICILRFVICPYDCYKV